jgi:hypothetical protein
VVCGSQQIRGFTGPDGKLVLSIAGGANNSGALPLSGDTDPSDGFAGAGCVAIEADGIPIRGGMNAVTVAAFDQSGMDGVRPSDDACQLGDYFGLRHGWIGRDPNRSDYDGNGMVLPSDRAIYLGVYFGIHSDYQSTSYANCGTGTGACSLIP